MSTSTESKGKLDESSSPKKEELLVYQNASEGVVLNNGLPGLSADQWAEYTLNVAETGRYRITISGNTKEDSKVWIEDYVHNTDGRTYDITGKLAIGPERTETSIDGSPLQKGEHQIRLHVQQGSFVPESIDLEILQTYTPTADTLVQQMDGTEKVLVWSDEFDVAGSPESTKWMYNIGNWGWGNNELQYYTANKLENARVEDGTLIIEAHKDETATGWSSARLTTQSHVTFKYGILEIAAKVPEGRGTWAAGWMLGDAYRDEVSWPYCGEIDVLECVGYEIDDATGNGMNHATCHTPAYYFKQGNQISADIAVENMNNAYHVYAMEWYPDSIRCLLDGEHYYTYDKTANELEWPFNEPQNIILNLAVGGGWGGAKGIDSSFVHHQFIIDYVRIYELQ